MNKIFKILIILSLCILLSFKFTFANEKKIRIGLLVPITGENKELGKLIVKSTRMAIKDIDNNEIEIYPKDTGSDPSQTLQSAMQLRDLGVKIVIGPIFYKSLIYLKQDCHLRTTPTPPIYILN